MGVKATLSPDPVQNNKYRFSVIGLVDILFTKVDGLEEEIDVVDLPDRTKVSGGNSKAVTFTASQPGHHTAEVLAMEAWYSLECKDPLSSTYKKSATLTVYSGTGAIARTYTMVGVWPSKRNTSDLSMEDAGTMFEIEWTFNCDSLIAT